jgi:hypothetical protein
MPNGICLDGKSGQVAIRHQLKQALTTLDNILTKLDHA